MAYFFIALFVFALYHFIYEAILAPSLRLDLRFEAFILRDELRNLKINNAEALHDRHFNYLQDSINTLIAMLARFDLATISQIENEIKRDPELQKRAELRLAALDDCEFPEAKRIRRASIAIASKALAVNSGGWLIYVVPGFMAIAIYLGLSSWRRRIKAVISISEVDMMKVAPPLDSSLGLAG